MEKITEAKKELLAIANEVNNGGNVAIIRHPDWRGGFRHVIKKASHALDDFEYMVWTGTPDELVAEMPTFVDEIDNKEYEATTEEILDSWKARKEHFKEILGNLG